MTFKFIDHQHFLVKAFTKIVLLLSLHCMLHYVQITQQHLRVLGLSKPLLLNTNL